MPGDKPACSRFPRLVLFHLSALSIERLKISIKIISHFPFLIFAVFKRTEITPFDFDVYVEVGRGFFCYLLVEVFNKSVKSSFSLGSALVNACVLQDFCKYLSYLVTNDLVNVVGIDSPS